MKQSRYCEHHVFSGKRHDVGGHQCGNPWKYRLAFSGKLVCARHTPEAIEAQKARTEAQQRERFERRTAHVRVAIRYALAPQLADALRQLLANPEATSALSRARRALSAWDKAKKT